MKNPTLLNYIKFNKSNNKNNNDYEASYFVSVK